MQKKVAVMVADGFEQSEFEAPVKTLIEANIILDVVSLQPGRVKGWQQGNWGIEVEVNRTVDSILSVEYDALLLPGGVMSPDKLRDNKAAVNFVRGFCEEGKLIAAICHGPWILIETGYAHGRRVTSFSSIKSDLVNAGAIWMDEEVVEDRGWITSRNPGDLGPFCRKMIEHLLM